MKKLALPLIGILFPLSVFSQFSLESSSTLPRANDTIVKQCVEYRDRAVRVPMFYGISVSWNCWTMPIPYLMGRLATR